MGALFGTDGIRGKANTYPMTPELALTAGRAIAALVLEGNIQGAPIIIGRDTRISGNMLESALAAGICAMGVDVCLVGILPTPGIAYLTRKCQGAYGIVISASHNPFFDNGIKVFHSSGFKLSDEEEAHLEGLILDGDLEARSRSIQKTGIITSLRDAPGRYIRFLLGTTATGWSLAGRKIVLDCANGATAVVAPQLFEELKATTTVLYAESNGLNINANCGSQHPETLAKTVIAEQADLGLAFDGDGDRLIAVDDKGRVLTGDQILAICASHLKTTGELTNDLLVSTVMSNIGLGLALEKMGITHCMTKVGDRYVMEEMRARGAVIGGEDSGHMIFLNHHTTGDGLLAALQLLAALDGAGQPLSELGSIMEVFPQALINVEVARKPDLDSVPQIGAAIAAVEKKLGAQGRVLVRYSGTQPMCRVMVEGPTQKQTEAYSREIAQVVGEELG